jgi:two-component system, OmpR family, phosphate regulon response regulator PhoB
VAGGGAHVLIVDDDPRVRAMLARYLKGEGFRVGEAGDGTAMRACLARDTPDLVLLDLNLPGEDGLTLARELRAAHPALGLVMVTGRADVIDKVVGLEVGADDYIAKPFSMDALLARMRALLRRSNTVPAKSRLAFADITLDLAAHRVQRNGRTVHLGPTEFRLLEFLMQHPRRVFSRQELLNAVWGHDIHVEPRTVDVHIRRLRKSINAHGDLDVVRTVRAAGYALDTEPI